MIMTSNKPYLIRAMYDWIVDNDLTPYMLVDTDYPGVQVPQEYVNGNRIVLNISPKACRGLLLEVDKIIFTARFSGRSVQILVLPAAVLAIYAKENHRGMEFDIEEPSPPPKSSRKAKGSKPTLKLVKSDNSK